MDKATMGTYLEMLRVVKFVIDTKTICLKKFQNGKMKNGVSKYFLIVIMRMVLRKQSAQLASLFIV
jgi:hypothetical protein